MGEAWAEMNRRSWNVATRAHNAHKLDQAAFLKRGGSTLFREELELLGDVAGKRLVHLQCNSGQDSLSLAALGAEVTGVDISDEAIAFARELSEATGIVATFDRADVYAWFERAAPASFDLAYSSYGFWMWLHDLEAWARGVSRALKPGGVFACVEFHQMLGVLDGETRATGHYFQPRGPHHHPDGVSDYVGNSGGSLAPSGYRDTAHFVNPHPSVEFEWRIEDMLNALAAAGFVLERFREYPFVNGDKFMKDMIELEGPRYALKEGSLPLMFGIRARRE